jgi:4-amino-4-deoxy-L-arabinose transferase-like glycosyltransferase
VGWPQPQRQEASVFAYDYPLLGVFWTIVLFSGFVLWIFIVVWALFDNFRRKDHSGWAKALWFLFILFLPIIGVFTYLVARPSDVDSSLYGQDMYGQEGVRR